MRATPRRIPAEPENGEVVRFTKSNGRYHYAAVRKGTRWDTTATGDWGSINEVMSWNELTSRVRRFEIARDWLPVNPAGNQRAREQFAVIRFTISGQYLVAINVANDGGYGGDWYTTITDTDEQRLPFGDETDWPDIARFGEHIQVVAKWEPL
jgi:hypothetical protein